MDELLSQGIELVCEIFPVVEVATGLVLFDKMGMAELLMGLLSVLPPHHPSTDSLRLAGVPKMLMQLVISLTN